MIFQILRDAIRANKGGNIIYLNNPKVGCSTVKHNLWLSLRPEEAGKKFDVHDIDASPFSNDLSGIEWSESARVFSFVRNPFSRLVSAYLNKIHDREPIQWNAFSNRYRISGDRTPTFNEFVFLISEDSPDALDPHWRPQHINLMYPFVKPNAIGKLERMDLELPTIFNRFLGTSLETVERKAAHSTGALNRLKEFYKNPDTLRRVIDLYYKDFYYFNYFLDIDAPLEGVDEVTIDDRVSMHQHPRLAALADLQRSQSPERRKETLDRVVDLVTQDSMVDSDDDVRAWLLHTKLQNRHIYAPGLKLVRDNLQMIMRGPDYLRRSATVVAGEAGAWYLCSQIAGASLLKTPNL